MSQAVKNIISRNDRLLKLVMEDEGFDTVLDMLERYVTDSIVTGVCVKCEAIESSCEPDATDNICGNCGENKVKSIMILAGII